MKFQKLLPKYITTMALSGVLFFGISDNKTLAHTPVQGGTFDGYSVDIYNHAGKAHVNYVLSSSIDSNYKAFVLEGAKKWYSKGVIHFWNDPSGAVGSFHKYSNQNSSTNAYYSEWKSDYNNHLYSWKIKLNTAKMNSRSFAANSITVVHELGHAVGLNDLFRDFNGGVLMYGYSDRSATEPTKTDLLGASRANW
ncbi:hypothetical protein CN679_27640 [Bacillus pseudomycoides]|uniref:hypothetical protein n=1 Tax=Bacillus pseudomycoides TaxID=64104 RepID=UPI000BF1107C|nr:hypothetical protein [Bacillus pseudomycoides]PEI82686.1 hypothetical protein CN679_27640 [Bacillus pseudomycoides]